MTEKIWMIKVEWSLREIIFFTLLCVSFGLLLGGVIGYAIGLS